MLIRVRFVITEQLWKGNIERCYVSTTRFYTIHFIQAEKCRLISSFDKLKGSFIKIFISFVQRKQHWWRSETTLCHTGWHSFMKLFAGVTRWSWRQEPRDLIREVKWVSGFDILYISWNHSQIKWFPWFTKLLFGYILYLMNVNLLWNIRMFTVLVNRLFLAPWPPLGFWPSQR